MTELTATIRSFLTDLDLRRGFYFDPMRAAFLVQRQLDASRVMVSIAESGSPRGIWFQSVFEIDVEPWRTAEYLLVANSVIYEEQLGRAEIRPDGTALVVGFLPLLDSPLGPAQFGHCMHEFTESACRIFDAWRRLYATEGPVADSQA